MMDASSPGSSFRAAAQWRPREALVALWYWLRGWLFPRPGTALLNGGALSFIGFDDAASPAFEAVLPSPATPALTVLELPMDRVLLQTLKLPERVRRHLDQVIEHNLPQWSPFSADEVLVAHRAGPPTDATFDLELRYVLRAHAQPIIESMQARGMSPIALALGDRAWLSIIDKARVEKLVRQQQRMRLLTLMAVFLSLCLWLAISWRQEAQLRQIQQARHEIITQLRQVGDEVSQLRKAQGAQRFVADSARVEEIVRLLATALPASVAPGAITVERGTLRLVVAADSAETVRAALAGHTAFEKLVVERGPGDQATITAALNSAKMR